MSGKQISTKKFWDKLAENKSKCLGIYPVLGEYKSNEFICLVKKWSSNLKQVRLLKTDLCEEAFGADQVLFSLKNREMEIFALDVSEDITKIANNKMDGKGFKHRYLTADVRNLPFKEDAFSLILSTSTLDHFVVSDDLKKSLWELKRVLSPDGCMIIALNNKSNINFYSMLKLQEIFKFKPYLSRFYHLNSIRRIFKEVGLDIQEVEVIVHIVSPVNSILCLLRKFISDDIVDRIAQRCVLFFKWLGRQKKSKDLTGWFIVVKSVKQN